MNPGARVPGAARFSSFLATVLTLTGVAIGLGNVWRFPYMMGAYGGSAFLFLFILFMATIAIPALIAELALARAYRGATITVLRRAFGAPGRALGYLLVAGTAIAMSYYSLVIGNVFYSAWFCARHGFSAGTLGAYTAATGSVPLQYGVALAVVWGGLYVIDRGLKRGIERVSNVFVPLFFAVIAYLVWVTLSLPGAIDHVAAFLRPDFARLGFKEVFAALGQCFFSVGLGATFVLVYGKFMQEGTDIRAAASLAAGSDLAASMLASLFIVPAVFAFGLRMDAGPGLLFETLPQLFAVMAGGRLIGTFMLGALALVAFLSMVAAFQVITVSLEEEPIGARVPRRAIIAGIGLFETAALLLPAMRPALIGPLDLLFGSGFPIIGCLLAVLAFAWTLSRPRAAVLAGSAGGDGGALVGWLVWWLRWVIPPVLALVLAGTLHERLSG